MFNCQAANKWKGLIKLSRGKKNKKKLHNRHLGWHQRKSRQHMMSYFSHVEISFSSNLTWTHLSRAGFNRYCIQFIWGGYWKRNGVRLSDRYANHIPYILLMRAPHVHFGAACFVGTAGRLLYEGRFHFSDVPAAVPSLGFIFAQSKDHICGWIMSSLTVMEQLVVLLNILNWSCFAEDITHTDVEHLLIQSLQSNREMSSYWFN